MKSSAVFPLTVRSAFVGARSRLVQAAIRILRPRCAIAPLLMIFAIAAHSNQPIACARQTVDDLVAELGRLQSNEEVASAVRLLLDGIRDEGRKVDAKGQFGAWAIAYAEKRIRDSVDTSPRSLSLPASRTFVGVLGEAYTTLYRSDALIELGDDPVAVFGAVDRVVQRVEERLAGAGRLREKARGDLKILAEQVIIGLPGSPPWAPPMGELLALIDSACAEVQRIAEPPRTPGQTSQQDFGRRVEELNGVEERFVSGLNALRPKDPTGGIGGIADPAERDRWLAVSRGYPDSMEDPIRLARSMIRVWLDGSDELSGQRLPGLPEKDYLDWLAELSQQQIRVTAAILGSLVSTASRESAKFSPGESREVDFVWSAGAAPVMACRATISRGTDGCAVVFGPLTATGWRFSDSAKAFGPFGTDVLAGAILSWSGIESAAKIHAPIEGNGATHFWDGGGRWGWGMGYNDPTPSWMTDGERLAPLITASAKAGLGETGTPIPALRLSFRVHYDFRQSEMRGVTEFDRDVRVELFTEPPVVLVEPVEGALAAASIGDEIRLDVFPRGARSRQQDAGPVRGICESAADRIGMRRVVGVDAGASDAAAIERYSAEALAAGDRLYAFLLDEAEFRLQSRLVDEVGKNRVLERLCRQLALPHDHPFRKYADERLRATVAPRFDGVTRYYAWLRSLPQELWHSRLAQTPPVKAKESGAS